MINSNRYDPLVPWTAANQLGRDWCAQGADVEFRTNEEPPFLNKLVVNHALPMLVDGELGDAVDRRPFQRRCRRRRTAGSSSAEATSVTSAPAGPDDRVARLRATLSLKHGLD